MSKALPLRKVANMSFEIDEEDLQKLVQGAASRHNLNEEQTQVLKSIARIIQVMSCVLATVITSRYGSFRNPSSFAKA